MVDDGSGGEILRNEANWPGLSPLWGRERGRQEKRSHALCELVQTCAQIGDFGCDAQWGGGGAEGGSGARFFETKPIVAGVWKLWPGSPMADEGLVWCFPAGRKGQHEILRNEPNWPEWNKKQLRVFVHVMRRCSSKRKIRCTIGMATGSGLRLPIQLLQMRGTKRSREMGSR